VDEDLSLNLAMLERLKTKFLAQHADFQSFDDCPSFEANEGAYKRALVEEAKRLCVELRGDLTALGAALIELLAGRAGIECNLIDWRAQKVVDNARSASPEMVEQSAGVLALAADPFEAVIEFVGTVWDAFRADAPSNPYAESRMVPTMLRSIVAPNDILPIRSRPTDNASRMLLGEPAFTNAPLSRAELNKVTAMAREIMRIMNDEWSWGARDLWDVQGFIWETCQERLEDPKELDPVTVWLVSSPLDKAEGLSDYLALGEWSLPAKSSRASISRLRAMQVGDRIVLSDYIPRASDLPFDANGGIVTANRILASGTITKIVGDDVRVGVEWHDLEGPRDWYFYTSNKAIWRLRDIGEKASADRLRSFLLNGEAQDYDWFLNNPFWRDRLFGTQANDEDGPMKPTNLILYGPPGTGKTFRTAAEAVRLCDGDQDFSADEKGRKELKARYDELVKNERVSFVTFHQNYSYEDFVEGLRPTQETESGETMESGFQLASEPGIFRTIAERAQAFQRPVGNGFDITGKRVFKMSLGEVANAADDYLFDEAIDGGFIHLGDDGGMDWSQPGFDSKKEMLRSYSEKHDHSELLHANHGLIDHPFTMRNRMREGDIVIVSKGNLLFRAIGLVSGDYHHVERENDDYTMRRPVEWLWIDRDGKSYDLINDKRFSQKTVYELSPENLKAEALSNLLAGDGSAEAEGEQKQFVLVIDEINRANISKVFGELITLIEPDKRLGMDNALEVELPYSKRKFGVPPNLHIVGTMNTADRSIMQIDTALRRRFRFEEMAPQSELLEVVDGVDLSKVLDVINARIEYLLDRDHAVGHAFFMGNGGEDRAAIDDTMRFKIIPLLQEYFFDDWRNIAAVLGAGFVRGEALPIPPGIEDRGERMRWTIRWQENGKLAFPDDAYDLLLKGIEAEVSDSEAAGLLATDDVE